MNDYEQLKNRFLLEVDSVLPDLPSSYQSVIAKALDRAAYSFEISHKQTALTAQVDPVPALVKTYIVVKKTEGLSNGTLHNYLRILKIFFKWIQKVPEDIAANDIRMFLYDYQQHRPISDRTLDKYRTNVYKHNICDALFNSYF